jgi:hypothetical protein
LAIEDGNMMGTVPGQNFVLEGKHYVEIFIAMAGLSWGGSFETNFGKAEGCIKSCSGYRLNQLHDAAEMC